MIYSYIDRYIVAFENKNAKNNTTELPEIIAFYQLIILDINFFLNQCISCKGIFSMHKKLLQ